MTERIEVGKTEEAVEDLKKAFGDEEAVFREIDEKFDKLEDDFEGLLKLAKKLSKTDDPKRYEKFAEKFLEKRETVRREVALLTSDPKYRDRLSDEVRDFLKKALDEVGLVVIEKKGPTPEIRR
ncbi:hypothetical protein KY339_05695 [Candidatus Woesearchaeota archaeon]|nr:hypothetical protein [Candidatus Woesearchaeota archaeon]